MSDPRPLPNGKCQTQPVPRHANVPIRRWAFDNTVKSEFRSWDSTDANDAVALEEPLEIRLQYGPSDRRVSRSLSITMRTPGDDYELAVGFLLSEGVVRRAKDILATEETVAQPSPTSNVVRVALAADLDVDLGKLQRHFYTTSSCGLCGKSSLEALEHRGLDFVPTESWRISPAWVASLPSLLRAAQRIFAATGGLHASGLFAVNGPLQLLREDVGRHNALDKLLGRMLIEDQLPLSDHVLVVSGRTSLELIQKAVAAGVPVLAGIGAPSSLAVDCAQRFGVTLLGFVSQDRFNCYAHPQRIAEIMR
ncbi:MAG: formate dehydrogenase accessory sulfurtransferase FdhD [Planctomycetaceae bacterium]|nr:formate dehydrogenase accessory sulfurtransferase FdhD [Planctomycetaceae bacterium]